MIEAGMIPTIPTKAKADYCSFYFPPHLILIIDRCLISSVSVTNDIKNILFDINKAFHLCNFISQCTVIYKDTQGVWDQVLLDKDGRFSAFKLVNKKSVIEAVKSVCGDAYDKYLPVFKLAIDQIDYCLLKHKEEK